MQTEQIVLKDFETIVRFVKIVNKYSINIRVLSKSYEVDAKSILALFGLDPDEKVYVATPEEDFPQSLKEELQDFKN